MLLEDEVKEFVNKIIRREGDKDSKEIGFADLLTKSNLDSFAYAVLWLELDDKYGCFNVLKINDIDYKTYKLKDVVEAIRRHRAS